MFENQKSPQSPKETPSVGHLLAQLPRELAIKHRDYIENQELDDTEACYYLMSIIKKRQEAMTETMISDKRIDTILRDPEYRAEILKQIEASVFQSPSIGAGQTACIKAFSLPSNDGEIQIAVKYLVTPTPKTLSASAEHDMLRELERIKTIEEIEEHAEVQMIRVPHPYFHHKNEHIQCYGMHRIDGVNLREVNDDEVSKEMLSDLHNSLALVPEEMILAEFEKFMKQMHTYCLHGDIKPANIMVSRTGLFYIIDFGQSVLVNDITDNEREQLDNLCEAEIENTRLTIKTFLKKLSSSYKK